MPHHLDRGSLALRLVEVSADRSYGAVTELQLPAAQRNITLEFTAEYQPSAPQAIVYRYRLAPFEEQWRQTRVGRAEYRDLAPGDYTFTVEAVDRDLNYSAPLQVALTIVPPWFKSPWKLLAVLLAAAGLGGGGLYFVGRYYQQRRQAAWQRRRQLALSQVREQVLQMEDSDDIEKVIQTVGANLQALEVPYLFCGVNIIDRAAENHVRTYAADRNGQWRMRRQEAQVPPLILQFWRGGVPVYRKDLFAEDPYGEKDHLHQDQLRAVVDVPFSHGTLAVSSPKPGAFTPSHLEILAEMTRVLEVGFLRVDDLRALEQRQRALAAEVEERQQAEEAATAANRAKSLFLANMSHEIRTPMNAILGYAQILDKDPQLTPQQQKAIETIGRSGRHLLALINDVLDISKIEAGREELHAVDFDLQELVGSLGEMFALRCQQQNLDWVLENQGPAGTVRGDEGKLRQVLINLLGNAIKFTPKGQVSLAVEARGEGQVYFGVKDTGLGIPAADQAAIFEPFHQADAPVDLGGTGLGLTIARRHVELMGGHLALESAPGSGAHFFFTLALPGGQAPDADPSRWERVKYLAPGNQAYILVVDDRDTNRDVLLHLLEGIGVEVETATSGHQALQQARRRRPDLIFLDIHMPEMDGMETLERLFSEHGRDRICAVAVTASVFAHQQREYIDAGFRTFIDKPLGAEQVYACLAEQLGVEYEYHPVQSPAPKATTDWAAVRLETELRDALLQAVNEWSLSQVRDGLERLAAAEPGLAAHLGALAEQYDMEGMQKILKEVKTT